MVQNTLKLGSAICYASTLYHDQQLKYYCNTENNKTKKVTTFYCICQCNESWENASSSLNFSIVNATFENIWSHTFLLLSLLILKTSHPNPRRREKIKLNLYFHTSLWCLKRFYEGLKGLHKTLWGTTKKCENKNLT